MYCVLLIDYLDSVEMFVGFGCVLFMVDDYVIVKIVDQMLGNMFLDSGVVCGFKCDYKVYCSFVFMIDLSFEYGNSVLVDNSFMLDSYIYL